MFSGVLSDHWSEATFHAVADDIVGVIRKFFTYLDFEDEVSIEGIQSYIWDERGDVVARLKKFPSQKDKKWAWVGEDDENVIAYVTDDHAGRHLRINQEEEIEKDECEEMEWDDFLVPGEEISQEDYPTMIAIILSDDHDPLMMMGSGEIRSLAVEASSRVVGPTSRLEGWVWSLMGGEILLEAKIATYRRISWFDPSSKLLFVTDCADE